MAEEQQANANNSSTDPSLNQTAPLTWGWAPVLELTPFRFTITPPLLAPRAHAVPPVRPHGCGSSVCTPRRLPRVRHR